MGYQTNISPFKNPVYLRLFTAQVTSLVGTGITTIALALLAWKLAENQAGRVLGTALAIKMVTYVFLSPIIASFAHNLPRRIWLVGLDFMRIGLVLCMVFVTEIWQIYLVLFLLNACSAGFTPIFQATIPDIINDERQYHQALSYAQFAYNLEQLISPGLAAILLTVMSFNGLFYLDAVTFFVSALIVLSCHLPFSERMDRSGGIWDNLRFGISSYLKTPRLRAVWVMYLAVASASAMVIVNTVVYVQKYLGGTASHTALAIGISGTGSMLTALVLPRLIRWFEMRKILLGGTFLLAALLLTGITMPGPIVFGIIWFFIGVGLTIVQTPVGSLIQQSCRKSDATAYFAANFSLSHLCWLVSYLIAGYSSAIFGLSTTFLILGIISFMAFIFAWKIFPGSDVAELEHAHEKMIHSHYHEHEEHHSHVHSYAETDEDHIHNHQHPQISHKHRFVIDHHHRVWP